MPTKNPRVNAVLEPPLYEWVKQSAMAQGISVSLKLRDIIQQAYELSEDFHWAKVGEERFATFNKKSALTHSQVWDN
ncbi:MAG: antitoxin, RHH family protein [Nitrospirota bacterium]